MVSALKPIRIENVGPIKQASIPYEAGHVTLLTGANGSGKTTALEAISTLVTGQGRPTVKDGELRGCVQWGDAKLTLGRSNRRSGELEVKTFEGRFPFDDLVDPGMKDDVAADAKSIKALVMLVGTKADPSLFYDLAGGRADFESIVKPESITGDDLVAMASKVKRDFEAAARKAEADFEHQSGHAKAMAESIVDLGAPSDKAALDAAVEAAVVRHASIVNGIRIAGDVRRKAETARAQLESAKKAYSGPSIEEAQADLELKEGSADTLRVQVAKLREELKVAEHAHEKAGDRVSDAQLALDAARSHRAAIEGWEASITEALQIGCPTDPELVAAQVALATSRTEQEQGVRVRDALKAKRKADDHDAAANIHAEEAIRLRDAARATDDVLSDVVQQNGGELRIETIDGKTRIVTETSRGKTFFRELSEGERVRTACRIAIAALSKIPAEMQLLSIGQSFWQDLDFDSRRLIQDEIRPTGIVVLTAECSRSSEDTELQAKVLA